MLYAYLRIDRTSKVTSFEKVMVVGIIVCAVADAAIAITFIAGLVIFLLGHVVYICGFAMKINWSLKHFSIIIPLLIIGAVYGHLLIQNIQAQEAWLIGPVVAYIIVISVMVLMAFLTRNPFAMIGSLLFYLSDAVLAWNMFVESLKYSTVYIMSTYYSAQLLIAHSINKIANKS
ncbi:lysoplasmalogenase [Alkalibacillus haloalkaliphilus]|uniref:lysoplasmalogenase n=1 Tax=Alkalibacillus haloalkaliphilus TaxID=94136 RepID=UPI002936A81C|nr:lysoplasmalogenase [Alkalibacillus haloalkaliphilus]MDV2582417.1 lysoplasmalogenase [Alkalibacillus haloalkaliphilus]